jgi:hypothetical protein
MSPMSAAPRQFLLLLAQGGGTSFTLTYEID